MVVIVHGFLTENFLCMLWAVQWHTLNINQVHIGAGYFLTLAEPNSDKSEVALKALVVVLSAAGVYILPVAVS